MARGWESKSVEEQMELAREEKLLAKMPARSDADIRKEAERESLSLTRSRVESDLQAAHNPRYRDILQKALDHVNAKLESLDG